MTHFPWNECRWRLYGASASCDKSKTGGSARHGMSARHGGESRSANRGHVLPKPSQLAARPAEGEPVVNGGIGCVVIASPYFAESIQRQLQEDRAPAFVIGEVREGESGG
jgi:hypothetical protein